MDEHEPAPRMESLESHYMKEYPRMLSFAARLLGDAGLAEVAVQETFVIALERMDKLDASPEPVGWLYNVLKNMIRHLWRDRNTVLERTVDVEDISVLAEKDEMETVIALMDLEDSPELRFLARLYVHGYTLKEIAAEEGITVAACKMRLKRAKQKLQEQLETYEV